MGFSRWDRRKWLLGAAVVVVAVGVVVWRGSGGGIDDVSAPATSPPPRAPSDAEGLAVELPTLPLLVDGRLRVTHDGRSLEARPIDADAVGDAFWSYRRDAALVGTDLAPDPGGTGPVVVAFWTDNVLVGLDGLTGERRWARDLGDSPPPDFVGYGDLRTDTGTAYLRLGGDDGDTVVVQVGEDTVATDVASGDGRWRRGDLSCQSNASTDFSLRSAVIGSDLVVHRACRGGPHLLLVDMATGDDLHILEVGRDRSLRTGTGCRPGSDDACHDVRWRIEGPGSDEDAGFRVDGGKLVQMSDDELAGDQRGWTWSSVGAPDVTDSAVQGDAAWAVTPTWRGGRGGLVRVDADDGSLTGCAPLTAGYASIEVYEDGWVLLAPEDSASVTLMRPDLAPTCPDPAAG